jgi:tetratricopeptide (TPR) repeat protein
MKINEKYRNLINKVLLSDRDEFHDLVLLANLDPSSDFRYADLQGVDFGEGSLRNFDFTGADLRGADFSKCKDIENCVLNEADIGEAKWPPSGMPKPIDSIPDLPGQAQGKRLFLSFESSQKPVMEQLAAALATHNIDVWYVQANVRPSDIIWDAVLDGLWSCHGCLVWWFGEYEQSRACQSELAAALASVAAARAPGTPARIFLVAPEEVLKDPILGRLKAERAAIIPHSPPTPAEITALAAKLAAKLQPIKTTFFRLADADPARPTEPSNPDFVGRARELLELHAALWPDAPGVEGTGSAQALVAGLGGQGKTALADEYARHFARSYPHGTFRLNLQGDAETEAGFDGRINSLLRAQAETLGLFPDLNATTAALRGALARALQTAPPYLWRVDDVPEFASAAQVQALRAPTNQGATLFTSRYVLPNVETVRLGRLDEANRLVRRIVGDRAPAADLQRLIDYVDGHALSLRLLAFRLKATGDASGILATLEQAPLAGLEAFATQAALRRADLTKGVYATLVSSFHLLEEGGEARALLGLLAHLARAPVPWRFLCDTLGTTAMADARDALELGGLLDFSGEPSGTPAKATELVRLHPLLADLALAEPGFGDAPQVPGWLEASDAALLADMQAIDKDAGHHRRDPLSGWLLPHARLRGEAALAGGETTLGAWVGVALHRIGDLPGARALQEQVLDARRRLLGPEHPDTLISMNNLAHTLSAQGDLPGARALQERVLDLRRRTLGPEHPDALRSLNNLAETLSAQGDLPGARELQEQVLEACRRTLGLEHPGTLISLNNLASTLQAQGDLPGARALQEQVLEAHRRLLGPEHPDALRSLNNLAETLSAQGDLPGARKLLEQALEAYRRLLGPEHPDTLRSLNNLAQTLSAQGDLPGARALQERVLDLRRRTLGPEHPDTLSSLNNLAGTLYAQGNLPGARALHEQVLEARRRTLGPKHPATLTSLNNLAVTLRAQGDLPGARKLQKQALEAYRRLLGPEHPDTLISMNNLAHTLSAQGDLPGARALQERVLDLRHRTLGPEHPDTLTSLNNLAKTLLALGETAAARNLIAPLLSLLPTLAHAQARTALTTLARQLKLLPPEAP